MWRAAAYAKNKETEAGRQLPGNGQGVIFSGKMRKNVMKAGRAGEYLLQNEADDK